MALALLSREATAAGEGKRAGQRGTAGRVMDTDVPWMVLLCE